MAKIDDVGGIESSDPVVKPFVEKVVLPKASIEFAHSADVLAKKGKGKFPVVR